MGGGASGRSRSARSVAGGGSGQGIAYTATLRDIAHDRRLVMSSEMAMDGTLATLGIMTVEFEPDGEGTRLRITEQDTFLDGHEQPSWREEGTASWLEKLGSELDGAAAGTRGR